ncbi:DUF4279 domain-containing protein [Micromonospora auratinigra]|uniref:DUF4279 domain-containing protein n=1 Tax=Micromonospora auratinigra TaxID=261654 RepID=A0A1A8ZDV8_9ACTN|nr:DUF4279 domain-containing protein [Micromonospora auratinigra]SBT42072.1 protein of unknown function (DUF4279) [Micromonospora auratinigra]
MRVRQYVYFSLRSEHVPAEAMTTRLGMTPDEILVRGSRRQHPPLPAVHAWKIVCRDGGLRVDEQIDRVIDRLEPVTGQIAALVAESDDGQGAGVTAQLQVVRYLNDDEGEAESPQPDDTDLVRLPGQHQLLGWHLDRRVLEFLHDTGAELDVDEYGYE